MEKERKTSTGLRGLGGSEGSVWMWGLSQGAWDESKADSASIIQSVPASQALCWRLEYNGRTHSLPLI